MDWEHVQRWIEEQKAEAALSQAEVAARYAKWRAKYAHKFKPYTFGATRGFRTPGADRLLAEMGIRHNDTDPR